MSQDLSIQVRVVQLEYLMASLVRLLIHLSETDLTNEALVRLRVDDFIHEYTVMIERRP